MSQDPSNPSTLPIAILGPFSIGAVVGEITSSIQEINWSRDPTKKTPQMIKTWAEFLSKVLTLGSLSVFLTFTSRDWSSSGCRAFPRIISSLIALSISVSLLVLLLR